MADKRWQRTASEEYIPIGTAELKAGLDNYRQNGPKGR